MEEWQAKRSHASRAPRLTTGFLDGTHPIVDAYELKVSLLQHTAAPPHLHFYLKATAHPEPLSLEPFLTGKALIL